MDNPKTEHAPGPVPVLAIAGIVAVLSAHSVTADTAPTLSQAFVGPYDFVHTGEALAIDTNANGSVDSSSQPASMIVSEGDVATGASVVAAYLYWGGSVAQPPAGDCAGGAVDDTVLFTPPGGSEVSVTADVFSCSDANSTLDIQIYRANVTTHLGTPLGVYTVDGFDALIGDGALDNASFSIVLVYTAPGLTQRRIVIVDGLERFQSNSRTLRVDGFDVAASPEGALSWWVLDGDVGGSGTEAAVANGTPGVAGPLTLQDDVNPADNPMNRTINTSDPARTDAVGVDIDRFDISAALVGGDTGIDVDLFAGTDSWWLATLVIAADDESLPEASLVVDGVVDATVYVGDGRRLAGVATDSELRAHIDDPNAHGSSLGASRGVSPEGGTALHEAGGESGSGVEFVRFHPDLFATALCEAIDYRYVDRGEGTILDCATGLIWLKDASCLGQGFWGAAVEQGSAQSAVARLNEGSVQGGAACDDYQGGMYEDWRLPTMEELCGAWAGEECVGADCCEPLTGVVDSRFSDPALANAPGDGRWSEERAFVGVHSDLYWTADEGWAVDLEAGGAVRVPVGTVVRVWAVRGGR